MGVVGAAQHHDFLTTYTGASMAASGEYARMHDPVWMFQRMREIDSQMLGAPVVRPHFYAFLVSPLAHLSVHTAFWVWFGIQTLVLFGCWAWAVRRFGPDALIWGALSIPCVLGIFHGQDCILMLAIAIGGYVLAARDRASSTWSSWAVGAVWALALMKFHLVLFLLPAMLVSKRWRMAGDAGGGEIGIIAPVSEPFCGHCNRLRLTADGKIRTCLFSIPEHDVRDRMRAGISDADLSDYLTNVVWQKEDRHHIGEPQFVSPERSMSCIGG